MGHGWCNNASIKLDTIFSLLESECEIREQPLQYGCIWPGSSLSFYYLDSIFPVECILRLVRITFVNWSSLSSLVPKRVFMWERDKAIKGDSSDTILVDLGLYYFSYQLDLYFMGVRNQIWDTPMIRVYLSTCVQRVQVVCVWEGGEVLYHRKHEVDVTPDTLTYIVVLCWSSLAIALASIVHFSQK